MNESLFSLHGKTGLVVGLANNASIAMGCIRQFLSAGASLAVTYQNAAAKPYAESALKPLYSEYDGQLKIFSPCDVADQNQIDSLFTEIKNKMGRLDFMVHCVASAPPHDLHGRVIDCTRDGFLAAMDVSCYSFIRLAKSAEQFMPGGGSIITLSYYGAEKVIPNYNMMGPVKAALESAVRELASELGQKNIRVNAISPGPVPTRAASGLVDFKGLQRQAIDKSPGHRLVNIDEIGATAVFLVSDGSKAITGTTTYVDAGYHIMA